MSERDGKAMGTGPRAVALAILQRLAAFQDGDAEALESLADLLHGERVAAETVREALRLLADGLTPGSEALLPREPGDPRRRVLTASERETLTAEAQGYLIRLALDGRLGGEDLEHVLERVQESGEPVDLTTLQEIVWQVTLGQEDNDLTYEADRYTH